MRNAKIIGMAVIAHQLLAAAIYSVWGYVDHRPYSQAWYLQWFFEDYWIFWGDWPVEGYYVPVAEEANVIAAIAVVAALYLYRRTPVRED